MMGVLVKGFGPVPRLSSGVLTLNPLPLDDLDFSGFGATLIVTALHRHSELLTLTVGTDEVHMGDLAEEVPVGALDVEVGGSGHVVSFDLKVL